MVFKIGDYVELNYGGVTSRGEIKEILDGFNGEQLIEIDGRGYINSSYFKKLEPRIILKVDSRGYV